MENNFIGSIQKNEIVSFMEQNKLFPTGTSKNDVRHFKNKDGKINFFILPPENNFELEGNIFCSFSNFSFKIGEEKSNNNLWQEYLIKKVWR